MRQATCVGFLRGPCHVSALVCLQCTFSCGHRVHALHERPSFWTEHPLFCNYALNQCSCRRTAMNITVIRAGQSKHQTKISTHLSLFCARFSIQIFVQMRADKCPVIPTTLYWLVRSYIIISLAMTTLQLRTYAINHCPCCH